MKAFLNIGIDHGASDSSIAVMESGGPRVLRVNGVDSVMPSVVYIDRRGRVIVGAPAYRALMTNDVGEGDGHAGYKIKIGQDDAYEFAASGKKLTAQQLGGHVIGALLRAYREETGEDPIGAVITVPAKFEHNACDGTREAARLAGLKHSPLIQEPLAAALAYGFTAKDERDQWMVFDLGSGTLDVSLVMVRRGQMAVPQDGHDGDNRLGGRKFDREVLEYVKGHLQKQYALANFREDNAAYRQPWGKLRIACEIAKVQLLTRTEAIVEVDGVLCRDERGKEVKVEVPFTRAMYEKLIAPDIDRAVYICRRLLERNRLTPKDLGRLILVGGPTRTPYVLQALANGLNMEVSNSVDPMTAVALGAAIYAATQEMPAELRESIVVPGLVAGAGASVRLEYERAPKQATCFVAGSVTGAALEQCGLTFEIARLDGDWSSGVLPVGEDGGIATEVTCLDAGKPKRSDFRTRVMDRTGKVLATLDEPQIWYPYTMVQGHLANSLVVVKGNQSVVLARKGQDLPCKGRESFATLKEVRKGSRDDVFRVHVLEGVTHLFGDEDLSADCCVVVGALQLLGDDPRITQDLPQGSPLDVTVDVSDSREIRCVVYVPLLDEEFEATFTKESFGADPKQVTARFEGLKGTLQEMEKLQAEMPLPAVAEKLKVIHDLGIIAEIEAGIEGAARGQRDAFYSACKRVLELAGALNVITAIQMESRLRRRILQLKGVATQAEQESLNEIGSELDVAAAAGNRGRMVQIELAVGDIDHTLRKRLTRQLELALAAESGKCANPPQAAVLTEGEQLRERLERKGGVEALTAADEAELGAMHRRFVATFPALAEDVKEVLEEVKLPRAREWPQRCPVRTGSPSLH